LSRRRHILELKPKSFEYKNLDCFGQVLLDSDSRK
jgi:hypothetical protein